MTTLTIAPSLASPSVAVEASYIAGEHADMIHRGSDTEWLIDARADFYRFVADRSGIRERWGVPSEVFWYAAGEHYIGSLVLRHELSEGDRGGHIGYHVVYPWQSRGHATTMLADGLAKAREIGLDRVLLTVAVGNVASRRVIARNGGVTDGANDDGQLRFWLDTPPPEALD